MKERLRSFIWLSQCFAWGSNKPFELLEAGADPERLLREGREYRQSFQVLNTRDLSRMEHVSPERADLILQQCEERKIWAISWEDSLFPAALRHIYGPPVVLYGKGNIRGLSESLCITIVGTRSCTDYAKKAAGNIAYQLARTGVLIVSGCAVGIDEYAHRGAIKAAARSIGVLACGADVNYPAATKQMRDHLLYRDGAVITELPPGTQPNRKYFATRNRLMAGLSEGVFVAQAPERSGALITAELAVEQGKELFCLPPSDIFSPQYQGVVPYLRDGAVPVYSVEDILSEYEARWADRLNLDALKKKPEKKREVSDAEAPEPVLRVSERQSYQAQPQPVQTAKKADPIPISLKGTEKEIYELLEETPRPMDEFIRKSGRKPQEVLSALTTLELLGLIQAYPGRMYGKLC